jgi:hypothetical protein
MTEAEWLRSEDPEAMHEAAFDRKGGPHAKRKGALFSAACCRLVWPWIDADPRCRRAVEFLETQFGDPDADAELDEIWGAVKDAARHPDDGTPGLQLVAANLVYDAEDTDVVISYLVHSFEEWGDAKARTVQVARILRDIVGNPFRTAPKLNKKWRTETAVALARQMYESRDFSAMPILADALQDTGCTSAEILDHCREPGPHVRGCWVCDLVLALGGSSA